MKEKKIKKWLDSYQVPQLNDEQVDDFIKNFEKPSFTIKRINYKEFIKIQLVSIRKRTWIVQAIILICWWIFYSVTERKATSMFDLYPYISIMAPIICIIGVDELSRIYEHHFFELELTTVFQLKTILLTRMSIMGSIDTIALTVMGMIINLYIKASFVNILLYIMVPFLLTCIGMLFIMRLVKGEYLNYFFCIYTGIIGIIPFASELVAESIYQERYLVYWKLTAVVELIVLIIQIRKLSKYLREEEAITKKWR